MTAARTLAVSAERAAPLATFDSSLRENSRKRNQFIVGVDNIPFRKAREHADNVEFFDMAHKFAMYVRNALAQMRRISMDDYNNGLYALDYLEELTRRVREREALERERRKGRNLMSKLAISNGNNAITIDSRDVAAMVGKRHTELLRDIRNYIKLMDDSGERKIAFTEYFIESSYTTAQNKTLPCYLVTRKGCEMIANKMTGQKGVLFTAAYIEKFHEMEAHIQSGAPRLPSDKGKRLEIQEKNARAKTASLYLRIAENDALPPDYRGIFICYASNELAGREVLPLPEVKKPTYSATDIGAMFGVSSQKIGKLANEFGLKRPEYGQLYHDKSPHSVKEVETFRYFDTAIPEFEKLIVGKSKQ